MLPKSSNVLKFGGGRFSWRLSNAVFFLMALMMSFVSSRPPFLLCVY